MAAVLAASLRRVVGEEKVSEAPYCVLLRRLEAQAATCAASDPCDVVLCGKHKDLFNVRVTNECVTLLAAAVGQ